ncbi:hypothetical protein MBLNU457_g0842t1 [Dothideomycetes sp. NU457]
MSTAPEAYPGPAPTPISTPTTATSSPLKFDSPKIFSLNHATTIWLIVIGVLFLSLLILLSWLLLRYTCTRSGRRRGCQILDQRQEFQQRRIQRPVGDVEAQEQQGSQEYSITTRNVDVYNEKESVERPRSVWWPLPPWGLASPSKVVVRSEREMSSCEEGRRQGVVFV